MVVVLAMSILASIACSSQSPGNAASTPKAEASAPTPKPPSEPQVPGRTISAEFRQQADVLDKYCVDRTGDYHATVQDYISRVEQSTTKKLAVGDFYKKAATLAPEVAKDEKVEKDGEGKYDCGYLSRAVVYDLVPELQPRTPDPKQ